MKNTSHLVKSFKTNLADIPEADTFWIAYSGGLDSTVLLHLLHDRKDEFNAQIKVVHINHGLNKNADAWADHTASVCHNLNLPYLSIVLNLEKEPGLSLEELARFHRYKVLSELMQSSDVLFTAHHQDDQVETFLLQLLRGAGPEGLAGMAVLMKFHHGWLARPLLNATREQVIEYATENSLVWIEDESNVNQKFDRNYIRHNVIPVLAGRWPSLNKTITRVAAHQAECASFLNEIAREDLKKLVQNEQDSLDINSLNTLDFPRKKNVLRYWIRENGYPVPGSEITKKIITELIAARIDAQPCIRWAKVELRRYRNRIYLMEQFKKHDLDRKISWNLKEKLFLDNGFLTAETCKSKGINKDLVKDDQVEIRYRKGGEKIRLPAKQHSQKLKKLFQEAGIPPWHRENIPLIYIDDNLVSVAGLWVDARFHAGKGDNGWYISFHPGQDTGPER